MARKLPRRVMSMTKRAGKLVEDANALLHDAEDEEGSKEDASADASSALDEEEHPPAWAYVGAWLAMLALVIVVLFIARLIFASDGANVPLGVMPHGEPTVALLLSDATPTPVCQAEGAVYSATLTHCVNADGTFPIDPVWCDPAIQCPPPTPITIRIVVETYDNAGGATIGGESVPALVCFDDEAIAYDAGGSLDCIPIDTLR